MTKPKSDILSNFGKRIKKLRQKRGLTQEDLASITDFHRTYISLIERGKRNLTLFNIFRFSNALDIEPHKLIEDL